MRTFIPLALLIVPALHRSHASACLVDASVQDERDDLFGRADRAKDEAGALVRFVVNGCVQLPSGAPAVGAVVVSDAGGKAVTDAQGVYRMELALAAGASGLQVTAVHSGLGTSLLASTRLFVDPAHGRARANDLELGAGGSCAPSWLPTLGEATGTSELIRALAVYDDGTGGGPALYVAGDFETAGAASAVRIAKWDGTSWSALGSGISELNARTFALAVYDDGSGGGPALIVGGHFRSPGGVSADNIAKWDGVNWSALGGGLNDDVRALTVHDDGAGAGAVLFVGGEFTFAGGVSASRIAKWDGTTWSNLGGGTNDTVFALAAHDDGSGAGSALYAGGGFTTAGDGPANRIAKWDGTSWSALGSGLEAGFFGVIVGAFATYDDGAGTGPALFVGGNFEIAGGSSANYVAKWDGTSWSALGSGVNDDVNALMVHDDGTGAGPDLYVGGSFTIAGGANANRIAKWNGTSWSPLGSGVAGTEFPTVRAFALFDDGSGGGPKLLLGGQFESAGGLAANHIAKWDGTSFALTSNGMDEGVSALAVYDDESGGGPALYVGGWFQGAGAVSTNHVAKWNGTTWSALGSGMDGGGSVHALAVHDDGSGSGPALYAGGAFPSAGGVSANHIAKWDGTSWSALGGGMNVSGFVLALAVYDDGSGGGPALYAGGVFHTAGGVSANRIAKWDGTAWSALGSGISGHGGSHVRVHALAVYDDGTGGGPALYAGGYFDSAGGVSANYIAKWDGTSWSGLGSGLNFRALSLAVHDDGAGAGPALYVGGEFISAGGVSASRIAKWDGTAWTALGTGMSGSSPTVSALAVYDDGTGGGPALYAGGFFASAGGVSADCIAKWDGTSWCGLESGMNGSVLALVAYDDGQGLGPALYAGGGFTSSSPGDSYLARWQGCAEAPAIAYCFGDGSASACPCGNSGTSAEGCANSSGSGARATAVGSTSVATDDLVFLASNLLPNQPALLFAGLDAVNGGDGVPFGDGLRCAGGNVRRLGVRIPNASGNASWGPGLGATGGWSAGDTRRFQLWYRDPTNSPCGFHFNLSHGLEIVFAA